MKKRVCVAALVGIFPLVALSALEACKHPSDDDDDKAPSATPAKPPAPPPTVSVAPEVPDAGSPPTDAPDDADASDAADAKKVSGDPTGVRACCSALRQNAKSAPPEVQGAYLMAAGACDTMAKGGTLQLVQLRGMLMGAGLPGTCK